MPPRKTTRSQKTASSQLPEHTSSARSAAPQLPAADENPPHLFILPEDLSPEARFVSLANPATSKPSRYLYCPRKGFYEITKVAAPKDKATPRSFLLSQNAEPSQDDRVTGNGDSQKGRTEAINAQRSCARPISDGYVLRDADLLVATPFDPVFLLATLFKPGGFTDENLRNHPALPAEDHFDTLARNSPHMEQLLKRKDVRDLLEQNMERIFEKINIGSDIVVYRQCHELLVDELMRKAGWTKLKGWPASMEQMARRRVELPAGLQSAAQANGSRTDEKVDGTPNEDVQNHNEEDLEQDAVTKEKGYASRTERLVDQMRTVTTMDFMLASYIHPELRKSIRQAILHFAELEEHLGHIEKLKSESQALQALSDNISRKRVGQNNDEAEFARAEKKHKKEEDEKKKQTETRGIKQLKKTDTTGMKKLSSFFTKAPDKKK